MKHNLILTLKGSRNYVHATSIFDSIVTLRHAKVLYPSGIDFSMRRFSNKQCCLIFDDENAFNNEDVIGEYRDNYGTIAIQETSIPLIDRIVYNEYSIANQCVIHGDTIDIDQDNHSNSFIEYAIGAYKILLQNIFGQQGNFFFFIRLTLNHISAGNFQIIYERLISKKYYQGSIFENHKKIGMIYFGVKTV